MTLFVHDTVRLLVQLDKALGEGDATTARRVVHSLKSSGAVVGAKQFADTAKRMEEFARTGDLASMATFAGRLRESYTAFCAIPAVQLLTDEATQPGAAAA
jgi:HPt (histidine-containing phosphotransfer) domain-containing protein